MKKRTFYRGVVYVTNPKHKLYSRDDNAFLIHFKTNAGYMVRRGGDWFTIPLKDGHEL